MKDLIKKGLALGLGLAVASKEQIEKGVDDLVKKGEVSAAESKDLVEELVKKGEDEQKELKQKVRGYLREFLNELEIPTKDDLRGLESRIERLENKE
ncbi:MAG: polyhydroxyalkanoate synthesis regulator [Desulfitobacteriaceae bacterium]|nr:polyhydroxyalkanoate synthesis regulator [Desulfitobacteriaceae bacterium]MDI6880347.1 polyhydroxyalkanoate synthesis regulator [Desulfitobacteriaceae bacterium]MDI6915713.1 polyhydroxyalkanoate synthesis regulator [Desulfitobacteriaceae bacterium]